MNVDLRTQMYVPEEFESYDFHWNSGQQALWDEFVEEKYPHVEGSGLYATGYKPHFLVTFFQNLTWQQGIVYCWAAAIWLLVAVVIYKSYGQTRATLYGWLFITALPTYVFILAPLLKHFVDDPWKARNKAIMEQKKQENGGAEEPQGRR